ncbi:MAG: hypothetical protein RIM99_03110 [Cyclobacteriaceae bacterium]
MGKTIYKNTLLFVFLFSSGLIFGQKNFNLDLNSASLNIDGNKLIGFNTTFDFNREEVRKGWWKYARKFGNPIDMRTYYVVTIPAESTDGNVDLTIYSQALDDTDPVVFSIGISDKKYKVQIEELLKEFKKDFYIQFYLNELKLKETEATGLSERYERALQDEKNEVLDLLQANKESIESLKEEIRKVEKVLSQKP